MKNEITDLKLTRAISQGQNIIWANGKVNGKEFRADWVATGFNLGCRSSWTILDGDFSRSERISVGFAIRKEEDK